MNRKRMLFSAIALWLAIVNCNLPGGQTIQEPSPTPAADLAGTITAMAALPLATAATGVAPSEIGPQATVTIIASSPTPCVPNVVANSPINVRSGPGTVYEPPIGSLPLGGSAGVAGKSDDGTWWYIDFPAGSGGHGWVSGSVVTASCIPSTLASIAAPPTPTPNPTKTPEPTPAEVKMPDLIISEFTISPSTPKAGVPAHVRVGVYNQGNANATQYVVLWYGLNTFANPSCSWTVDFTNANGGRILECDFTFQSPYALTLTSLVIADANSQVAESNEDNNRGVISPFGVNP